MTTIVFEDHGQDFLEWDVDDDGVVVGCRPFQAPFWCGVIVEYPDDLKPGDLVFFYRGNTVVNNIKYPVMEVRHGA